MSNSYEANVKTCRCDVCKRADRLGVEHVVRGTPVFFECRECAPVQYRKALVSEAKRAS
jgi:hypothetical protein